MQLPPCVQEMLSLTVKGDYDFSEVIAAFFKSFKKDLKDILTTLPKNTPPGVIAKVIEKYSSTQMVFSCDLVYDLEREMGFTLCNKEICPLVAGSDDVERALWFVEDAIVDENYTTLFIKFKGHEDFVELPLDGVLNQPRKWANYLRKIFILQYNMDIDLRPRKDDTSGVRIEPIVDFVFEVAKRARKVDNQDPLGVLSVLQNILSSTIIVSKDEAKKTASELRMLPKVIAGEWRGEHVLMVDPDYLHTFFAARKIPVDRAFKELVKQGVSKERVRIGPLRKRMYIIPDDLVRELLGKSIEEILEEMKILTGEDFDEVVERIVEGRKDDS